MINAKYIIENILPKLSKKWIVLFKYTANGTYLNSKTFQYDMKGIHTGSALYPKEEIINNIENSIFKENECAYTKEDGKFIKWNSIFYIVPTFNLIHYLMYKIKKYNKKYIVFFDEETKNEYIKNFGESIKEYNCMFLEEWLKK